MGWDFSWWLDDGYFMGISWDNGNKGGEFECMMRSYVILIANDSDSMANDSDYIYIYGPVLRLSTPPMGWVPR